MTDYENGGDTLAGFIKYKDLGKSEYNYDSDYYKKYRENSDFLLKFKNYYEINKSNK